MSTMTAASPTDFGLHTMIPDLLSRFPQARPVLDRYGLHGCGGATGPVETLGFFARTHGVEEDRLLSEIRSAIANPLSAAAAAPDAAGDDARRIEDTIYRRFFIGGILTVLTAGATWGAMLLLKIGGSGKFTGVTIHEVNAHGHAQIYGWVGLFIMGFALQAFPRLWHTRLAWPVAAVAAFVAMLAGIVLRTVGMNAAGQGAWALWLANVGGALELASVAIFVIQMLVTFARSGAKLEPYVGFAIASLAFFLLQTGLDVWHTWVTMTAPTREALLWQIATWQAPLRDLQIHGLALLMILGVNLRMLPALFNVPKTPTRRSWIALGVLIGAVVLEVAVFVVYRYSGQHYLAAFLLIPWLMLVAGIWMVAGPWKLWRGLKTATSEPHDRTAKFITTAYAWLAISLVMLLLLPVHHLLTKIPFSHAYYGAIRHAITVGFISLMIMGFAAKVVPTLNGLDARNLGAMWGPFILINLGCFLRVSLQSLTDADPAFFKLVGISGVLEVSALTWWGLNLIAIMHRGKRAVAQEQFASARPHSIEPDHIVADVVRWFPQAIEVFASFGFDAIRNPFLRATLARTVTIRRAAAMKSLDLAQLLTALNAVLPPQQSCATTPPAPNDRLPDAQTVVQLGIKTRSQKLPV